MLTFYDYAYYCKPNMHGHWILDEIVVKLYALCKYVEADDLLNFVQLDMTVNGV